MLIKHPRLWYTEGTCDKSGGSVMGAVVSWLGTSADMKRGSGRKCSILPVDQSKCVL